MLRATFANLDPAGPPQAVIAAPPRPPSVGGRGGATPTTPLAILAGSFDPLTNAHLALAHAAHAVLVPSDAVRLMPDAPPLVFLALSRHTVDKEARVRPTDADRALALRLWASRQTGYGVLLFNRGLYADQALAARAAFPDASAIHFIVGFDKARQIFDPRYYTDRDAALRILFANASLLVAPRADAGPDALVALLDQPENRPFRDAVHPLPLDPAYSDDSSTTVRNAARAGLPYATLVPPETSAFINTLHPYDPPTDPDPYALRDALIAALEPDRPWAEAHIDLQELLSQSLAPDTHGLILRTWLATPPAARYPTTFRAFLTQ